MLQIKSEIWFCYKGNCYAASVSYPDSDWIRNQLDPRIRIQAGKNVLPKNKKIINSILKVLSSEMDPAEIRLIR
jgi:hypothetical protein